MPRVVVLLRGVNVGKGNRVPMAEFKGMLAGLGCQDVATLLNSGNAVCTSPARSTSRLAEMIAVQLQQALGVSTPVIVKSASEFRAIIEGNPMPPPEGHHSRFLVAFGPDAPALQALTPLVGLAVEPERLVITPQAGYLYCARGILESKVGAAVLGRAGRGVTTRNWATVLKLGSLLAG